MKKALLIAATLLIASLGFADNLDVHNYSVTIGSNNIQQGCRGCHAPHGGAIIDTVNQVKTTVFGTGYARYQNGRNKLWDKDLSSSSYTTYSSDNVSAILLGTPSASTDPNWHSYLCFSCHDGNVAALNLPSSLISTFDNQDFIVNAGNGDVDLTNDHPVGISLPTTGTLNDGLAVSTQYDTPANISGGTTGQTNTQALPLYGGGAYLVECSTCHNVHVQPTSFAPGAVGLTGNFLRMNSVDNVSLCRACHVGQR